MSLPTPPAMPGLPLIGNLLDYQRDPVALLMRGYRRFGHIFSFRLGPRRAVVLLGPEHHRFFFSQTGGVLSRRESLKWMIPMFGEDFPVVTEGQRHRELIPIYTRPFHEGRMAGYVKGMAQPAIEWLGGMGHEGECDMLAGLRALITSLSTTAILGRQVVRRAEGALPELLSDMASGTSVHWLRNLSRLLPSGSRRQARQRLVQLVQQALDERRVRPQAHDDFMQALLDDDAAGPVVDDEFAARFLIGLTWVGLDTTIGQLSWSLVHLLQHPECLARVVAEQDSIAAGDAPPDLEQLDAMTYLDQALQETERLQPAVRIMGRGTTRTYELGGYRVPAGWLTLISPPVTHRLPEVFDDAERYDPDRFAADRSQSRRPPYSLIGFGGGRHVCAGKRFALLEMKLALSLLLRRYELTLVTPNPVPRPGPHTNSPRGPVTVRYRPRTT